MDDLLEVPISALEHYSYCPRQCALIHVDRTFEENVFTIKGRLAHERAHKESGSLSDRGGTVRGVPLWSDRLGLIGKADVVEFREGAPFPIEYKVGPRRKPHADIQLCAQALCLEEMLEVEVPAGAIFSLSTRRRHRVKFTDELRAMTTEAIASVRVLMTAQFLPLAPNDERCPPCSLILACLPGVVGDADRMRGLQGSLFVPLALGAEGV